MRFGFRLWRAWVTAAVLGVGLGTAAIAQTAWPTLPPNTAIGRLGIGSGPAQAIPFAALEAGLASAGVLPTPYPYDYNSATFTGAGLQSGAGTLCFLNQNCVWDADSVYPEIWNSTAPWAVGYYGSCIGTLTNTSGSGTCTPASVVNDTYCLNITGYSGAPGNVCVTAATTNAGTTATALCAAVQAAVNSSQIYCDPTTYGGDGYFNVAWSLLLNGSVAIAATGSGTISLTDPSNASNEDAVVYQFDHNIPGYTLQANDSPICQQWFSQQAPITQICQYVESVSGGLTASTRFYSIVGGAQYDVLDIGNGLRLDSPSTGGANLEYEGVGTINVSSDGGYYADNVKVVSGGGTFFAPEQTDVACPNAIGLCFFHDTSTTGEIFSGNLNGLTYNTLLLVGSQIQLDPAGSANALLIAASSGLYPYTNDSVALGNTSNLWTEVYSNEVSALGSGFNPTTGQGVTLLGGGSHNSLASLNWAAGAWQAFYIDALTINFEPSQSTSAGWNIAANELYPATDNATTLGTSSLAPSIVYSHAFDLFGSSTGLTSLSSANAGATNYTATLPAATDTIVELTQTQTLSNKSIAGSEINSGLVGSTYGGTGTNNGSSTITVGGSVTFSGAHTFTGTLAANTAITFPATGNLLATSDAAMTATPSNPTGSASSTGLMMGLGGTCSFTPVNSTRAVIDIYGDYANSSGGAYVQAYYGAGTAPSNQASPSGTAIGTFVENNAESHLPFHVGGVITGLTVGTAYWLDLDVKTGGAGTATPTDITCSVHEV